MITKQVICMFMYMCVPMHSQNYVYVCDGHSAIRCIAPLLCAIYVANNQRCLYVPLHIKYLYIHSQNYVYVMDTVLFAVCDHSLYHCLLGFLLDDRL